VPSWTVTAGAEWRPLPELAFTATLRSFPAYWNDTGHTQLNDAATLIDVGVTYSPAKAVDIYASIQNLTNANYLAMGYTLTSFEGPTVSTTSIPALGMPLTATVGLRARF
jgi:outer membrane receptor protein involved in Fe transport